MPDLLLAASFVALLSEFRGVFVAPSFANFVVLVSGTVHAMGEHRLTDALRAAGPTATRHFTTCYRFFSHAKWSLDVAGFVVMRIARRLTGIKEIELVPGDTLCRRSGKEVALATMHADPLLKQGGRPFHSCGHVYVVLAVHVTVAAISPTGRALPVIFRLFQGSRQGGRRDAASDKRRRPGRRRKGVATRARVKLADREVVDGELRVCAPEPDTGPIPDAHRPGKTELAAEMIPILARRFPDIRFREPADHLYHGRALLHGVLSELDNVCFVTR